MGIPFSSNRRTHRILTFMQLLRLWLCLALGSLALQAQALVVSASDGAQGPRALSSGVGIQRDPSGQWTIADVAAGGARHGGFAPLNGAVEEGFTRDTVWLRLSLSRTPEAPSRWLLRLRPPRISEAVLYSPDGHGGFTQVDIGDRQPFAQREIPDHNFVYPLQLSTEPVDYFLKLRSDGPALRAELDLWQATGFAQHRTTDYAVVGLLVGAAILSVCMNLIFMAWLRDSLYGHYALYVVGVAALTLNRQGFVAQWLLDAHPERVAQTLLVVNCLFNVVATTFMARIFGFRQHWKPAAIFFDGVAAFNLLACFVALTSRHPTAAPWVSAGSVLSTSFGGVFVAYLLIVRRQWQYLLPASAFAVGTILGIYGLLKLWLGDWLPGAQPERLYVVGSMMHLVLLNAAVANRTRRAEIDVRVERDKVLSVRLEAERQLESTVVRRTAELASANAMLHEEIAVRARLENQLMQALQVEREAIAQQREFVAMVSHEFRTPLTAIDAAAQSLEISRLGAEPAVRSRTERIRRAVQRLTMLIENVMLADRLQSASHSLRLDTLDIVELTQGLCDSFHLQSPSRIRLELHVAAEVWVRADRALLDIALRNLVHNALKYSAADRSVIVALKTVAGSVYIDVTDQGEGIAPHDAPRIFEKYFRAESASRVPGTGLGLHLSRDIARLHGGDVELVATSEAGSVFRLRLPLSA
ncbi:sensor histidine kinase [Variovorax atrisoli]|uniref:sensor histidine kinase n=1 Tax=Variovorax atrisoli TaxID=3394203 RepID=UPI0003A05D8E|nr:sensor histidine kinase [Variovorax paradoxus]